MNNQPPLYLLACDHDSLFIEGLLPDKKELSEGERDQIRRIKLVIYEGFKKAIEKGLPKDRSAMVVDENLGEQILINSPREGYHVGTDAHKLTKGHNKIVIFAQEVFWQPVLEFFQGHIDAYAAAVAISDNIISAYKQSANL